MRDVDAAASSLRVVYRREECRDCATHLGSDYIMSVIFLTERAELVYAATFTSLDEVFGSTSRVGAMTNYRAR